MYFKDKKIVIPLTSDYETKRVLRFHPPIKQTAKIVLKYF